MEQEAREERLNAEGLPACDDTEVKNVLVRVIEKSPAGNLWGLRVEQVSNAKDYPDKSYLIEMPKKKLCSALLYTSVGKRNTAYTLEWMDTAKTKFFLEISWLLPSD